MSSCPKCKKTTTVAVAGTSHQAVFARGETLVVGESVKAVNNNQLRLRKQVEERVGLLSHEFMKPPPAQIGLMDESFAETERKHRFGKYMQMARKYMVGAHGGVDQQAEHGQTNKKTDEAQDVEDLLMVRNRLVFSAREWAAMHDDPAGAAGGGAKSACQKFSPCYCTNCKCGCPDADSRNNCYCCCFETFSSADYETQCFAKSATSIDYCKCCTGGGCSGWLGYARHGGCLGCCMCDQQWGFFCCNFCDKAKEIDTDGHDKPGEGSVLCSFASLTACLSWWVVALGVLFLAFGAGMKAQMKQMEQQQG